MNRRLAFLLSVGAILVMNVALYWAQQSERDWRTLFSSQPVFEGKTITYWLEHWQQQDGKRNVGAETAIRAIGAKGIPVLIQWIRRSPNFGFGLNYPVIADQVFEKLGPEAAPAIPELIKIIGQNSDYPETALVSIGRPAVPLLAERLVQTLADTNYPFYKGAHRIEVRKTSGYYVRNCILNILEQMDTNAEAALPALITVVSTPLPDFRFDIYRHNPSKTLAVVGRNHPETVVPVLLQAFTGPPAGRGEVAQAMLVLGANQSAAFLPVLLRVIHDGTTNDENRIAIAEALATIGRHQPETVVPELIRAFTNSAVRYQGSIAKALSEFGPAARSALPVLLAASHGQDLNLRREAAVAAKIVAPDNSEALVPLIKEINYTEDYRRPAIYALGQLGTNALAAVPALLKCLDHPHTQTRADAIRALNDIGVSSDEYISALGDNLSCTNRTVAELADETLANLAGHCQWAYVTLLKKGMCGPVSREDHSRIKEQLVTIARANPEFLRFCMGVNNANEYYAVTTIFQELYPGEPSGVRQPEPMKTNADQSGLRYPNSATPVLRLQ